jgi:multicomponent Na+:H+ antiporter subunit F
VAGPSVPDRIVALDALLLIVVSGIAVGAAATRDGSFLAVLVAVALLGFVGTVTVARFVERRGAS